VSRESDFDEIVERIARVFGGALPRVPVERLADAVCELPSIRAYPAENVAEFRRHLRLAIEARLAWESRGGLPN
jgi:hypothetical protein